jgi:cell wall-associated NlpC family hydrolase
MKACLRSSGTYSVVVNRQDIVNAARSFVGVRFVYSGRLPIAMDCLGLVYCVCQSVGINWPKDGVMSGYDPRIGKAGERIMERATSELVDETFPARPGDLLSFWMRRRTRRPHHVAIVNEDGGMIFACNRHKRVVETELLVPWRERLIGAFHIRGVEWQL